MQAKTSLIILMTFFVISLLTILVIVTNKDTTLPQGVAVEKTEVKKLLKQKDKAPIVVEPEEYQKNEIITEYDLRPDVIEARKRLDKLKKLRAASEIY